MMEVGGPGWMSITGKCSDGRVDEELSFGRDVYLYHGPLISNARHCSKWRCDSLD